MILRANSVIVEEVGEYVDARCFATYFKVQFVRRLFVLLAIRACGATVGLLVRAAIF